jgi:hypothetical protein
MSGPGSFPPPPGSKDQPGSGWGDQGAGQPGWGQPGQGGQQGRGDQGAGQPGWGQPGQGGQPSWGAGGPGGEQQWTGAGYQQGYGQPPATKSNSLAVAALVAGILSLLCLLFFILIITIPLAFVAGVAGIVLGVLGLRAGKRDGTGGRGMAITGIATGGVTVALMAFVFIAVVTVWNSFGFETNPFTDPEGFVEELEQRGIQVEEDGSVDLEELQRQLEEQQG